MQKIKENRKHLFTVTYLFRKSIYNLNVYNTVKLYTGRL